MLTGKCETCIKMCIMIESEVESKVEREVESEVESVDKTSACLLTQACVHCYARTRAAHASPGTGN